MKKNEMEQLIKELEVLSNVDDYAEVMYPILINYLYYRLGRLDDVYLLPNEKGFWDSGLGRAFTILNIEE